jgi:hypothetical protein
LLSLSHTWSWVAVALLGAFHGLNPAMGWLFAVALGLQERRVAAAISALAPIALGHALSVGIVVLFLSAGAMALPPHTLRIGAAVLLISFGLFRLLRPRAHFRWVGMRVGFGDLVLWSFLMATAHGAGLMLAPVLLQQGGYGLALVGVHTVAMLLVMAGVALVVYQTIGLGVLRRAWINVDLIWAAALIMAGIVTALIGGIGVEG